MKETKVLVVGASISGLATAATLQRKGVPYLLIEKTSQIASPWRNHYDRLHLHTHKSLSHLPFRKFPKKIPRYPSRNQVVEYLDDYAKFHRIHPEFNTEALSIEHTGNVWITHTSQGNIRSKYLIMATGPYGSPRKLEIPGLETFPGKVIHSSSYKTGNAFSGKRVLVIGFGNSACEIAIDLYEQGATPLMSVRSAVNVIPRDILGISILRLGILFNALPPKLTDRINAPLIRSLVGDITKLGLKKKEVGPMEQVRKEGSVPLLDIGTLDLIRKGHIAVRVGIDHINDKVVYFNDGKLEEIDHIISAIGYYQDFSMFKSLDEERIQDLKNPVSAQKFFGKNGLYFCGFWISPTGSIREIGKDALGIAKHIVQKEKVPR